MKKMKENKNMILRQAVGVLPFCLFTCILLLCGCSSDSSDDNGGTPASQDYTFAPQAKPTWAIDWKMNQQAPEWNEPDPVTYECTMYLLVRLQDELVPYVTDTDQMCVMIGGQCRGLSPHQRFDDGGIYFWLTVEGDYEEQGQPLRLAYYSHQLQHLFTIDTDLVFADEVAWGDIDDYVPDLLRGNAKYPVQTVVTPPLPSPLPFTQDGGDCMAVFVGAECRGVASPGQPLIVYGLAGESGQLRYYSVKQGGVFTFKQAISIR